MKIYKKIAVLPMLIILSLFAFTPDVTAQNCEDSFNNAADAYYNGDYGQVHGWLSNCIREFESSADTKNYYISYNQERVFQVYKLITSAYYQTDEDYRADEMIDRLIGYFSGYLSEQEVVDRLYSTGI